MYTGTVIAPIDIIAKSEICHSGLFSDNIITLSPFKTPKSISDLATDLTDNSISSQDNDSNLLLFFFHK